MMWGFMENRSELENLKKEMKSMCISLQKFLINYCGIYNEKIYDIKITHQDIKELMPQIKRISFEELLKNKKDLYVGNIIAVKDSLGNVVPYVNPMLELNEISQIYCKEYKEEEIIPDIIFDKKLCLYDLVKVCRYYKVHNKLKEYRIAHKLLEEENTSTKQYKKKREKLMMKGRDNYEEY